MGKETKIWTFSVFHTENDIRLLEKACLNYLRFNFYQGRDRHKTNLLSFRQVKISIELSTNGKIEDWNFLLSPLFSQKGETKAFENPWSLEGLWTDFIKDAIYRTFQFTSKNTSRLVSYTVNNYNDLEMIGTKLFATESSQPLYPDVLSKAAVLMYEIANSTIFSAGNKRIALFSTIAFLNRCGLTMFQNEKLLAREDVDATLRLLQRVASSNPEEKEQMLSEIQVFLKKYITLDELVQAEMIKEVRESLKRNGQNFWDTADELEIRKYMATQLNLDSHEITRIVWNAFDVNVKSEIMTQLFEALKK